MVSTVIVPKAFKKFPRNVNFKAIVPGWLQGGYNNDVRLFKAM